MPHKTRGVRQGQDAATTGGAQSGPNRGTNTGVASPGGVAGSKRAGAAKRGGTSAPAGNRSGPVTIPGAGKGATTISGTAIAGVAKKG